MNDNNALYLRPNVQLEPLVNRWYAWSHLISPVTAAMNVAYSHVPMMRSYVSNPQIHAAALRDPAMRGGPFIDYDGGHVEEIRSLLERTRSNQARMIALAEAMRELNAMLAAEATGGSLEPLYARVPEILKGYVELVYDPSHHATARLLEGLLYRSEFYDPNLQSLALSLVTSDSRSFVLSTPRIPTEHILECSIPFRSAGIDRLFAARERPEALGAIREALGLEESKLPLLRSLFTESAPRPAERFEQDGLRIRYFGHACILFETRDVTILVDPVVSYEYPAEVPRLTLADLPAKIDYVLITHNHQDHLLLETLLQLRSRIGEIVVPCSANGGLADPSLKLMLTTIGFRRVREIDEMESIEIPGGEIVGLPFLGEHGDLNIRTKTAHMIRLLGTKIVCAADSNNLEPALYDHIHAAVGDVDVLFLGMECDGAPISWLYGPLLTKPLSRKLDQSRRFCGSNCERGMGVVERMRCQQVYVYALGQEPWLSYITSIQYTDTSNPIVESSRLVAQCRERGLIAERLFAMKTITLPAR